MLESLLVILILVGYIVGGLAILSTLAYICLIVKEFIDNIKMRYFPERYYYDWDEEA